MKSSFKAAVTRTLGPFSLVLFVISLSLVGQVRLFVTNGAQKTRFLPDQFDKYLASSSFFGWGKEALRTESQNNLYNDAYKFIPNDQFAGASA
jgi:hypothetical protein